MAGRVSWPGTSPAAAGAALVGALLVLTAVQLALDPPPARTALFTLCAIAAPLGLVLARTRPLAAALVVTAAVVGQAVVGHASGALPTFSAFLSSMAATGALARYASRLHLAAGLAMLAAAVLTVGLLEPEPLQPFDLVYPVAYLGAAGAVGETLRRRAAHARLLEDRARMLEREREQQARLAVAEERAAIARELHDVVAHSVSLMVLQAEAAAGVLGTDPTRVREPLERIQRTGRGALTELQHMLGVLRADVDTAAPLTPLPGLSTILGLVEDARAAGLAAELNADGFDGRLPAGVELTAFRVVQESLTNTRRHAQASRVAVSVCRTADGLTVEVEDDGRADTVVPGHGLIGMRERVALCGGQLDYGPRPEGGFRVTARLPLGGVRP